MQYSSDEMIIDKLNNYELSDNEPWSEDSDTNLEKME